MPYPTTTKHYSSTYPNAPTIIANAGGYVGFLDAILVTGYGLASVTNIVVTSGTAVATVGAGHSLRKWMVALHAGTGHAGLDGEHRAIDAAGNTYTFEVAGVPDGTYTGGTTKVAPLGFEIQYTATNKRIYRSLDVLRNSVSLYVDDTNTVTGWNPGTNKALAQARMVCDVSSITGFTTLDTTWWFKSAETSGTTARPWMLAGDALGFYTAVGVNSDALAVASNNFLQFKTLAMGDMFATVLEGVTPTTSAATTSAGVGSAGAGLNAITHGTRRVARSLAQSGAALDLRYYGLGVMHHYNGAPGAWMVSGGAASAAGAVHQAMGVSAINPADAGVILGAQVLAVHSPVGASFGNDWTTRGVMPGLFSVPSVASWSLEPTFLPGPAGPLLALPANAGGESNAASRPLVVGGYCLDITGAWR